MRLIDADELKKVIFSKSDSMEDLWDTAGVLNAINNTPTVELTETEIQEVLNKRCMSAVTNEYLIALHTKRPRGKWINDDNDLFDFKKCSNCGECAEWLDGGSQLLSNFCPNCGARMEVKK